MILDYFYNGKRKRDLDEKFLDHMICIESLLNDCPSDTTYKLALRSSFLLGLFNFDSIGVFDNFKKYYTSRNNIVHEGISLKNPNYAYSVEKYAKSLIFSILVLLTNLKKEQTIIKKNIRKKYILNMIDHTMISPSKRNALEIKIKKDLKDFKLTSEEA